MAKLLERLFIGISFCIVISAMLASLSTFAFAEDSVTENGWTTCNTCEWKFDESTSTFTIRPLDGAESGKISTIPWKSYKNRVEVIEFEGAVAVSTCKELFSSNTYLREIKGLENLDTSQVQSMCNMFASCSYIKHLDLGALDTSKVTDMSGMFYGCDSLESIVLSGLDTSNVTNMGSLPMSYGMFQKCSSLKSLNLSGFDTSKVESMDCMFDGCTSLKKLDLAGFDTSKVTSMHGMLFGCSSLESAVLGRFDTGNVTDISCMFSGCASLENLDVSGFDTSYAINAYSMFAGCGSLKALDVSNFNTRYMEDLRNMFDGCQSLEFLDVSNFDTARVADMSCMFRNCKSLTSIDVSGFQTRYTTSMSGMFDGCESLKALRLDSFDTSKVVNMRSMFEDCSSIKDLDLSGFRTQNVKEMSYLFKGCQSLKAINLSNFEINSSCVMNSMFDNCRSLEFIDMSNFDTTKVDLENFKSTEGVFPKDIAEPSYEIKIGAKFTLQPYLTMGYWENEKGALLEEFNIPQGVSGKYAYKGGIKDIVMRTSPFTIALIDVHDVDFVNIIQHSTITYDAFVTNSNPEIATTQYHSSARFIELIPKKAGRTTITVSIGDKTKSCEVIVVDSTSTSNTDSVIKQPSSSENTSDQRPISTDNKVDSATKVPSLGSVSIIKLVKAKRGLSIKWKKPAARYMKVISGYKIRYSTSKTMKNKKVKTVKVSSAAGKKCLLKIVKLKAGQRYYVQIASYKKLGGKKYYSKWSKIKSVKTL